MLLTTMLIFGSGDISTSFTEGENSIERTPVVATDLATVDILAKNTVPRNLVDTWKTPLGQRGDVSCFSPVLLFFVGGSGYRRRPLGGFFFILPSIKLQNGYAECKMSPEPTLTKG